MSHIRILGVCGASAVESRSMRLLTIMADAARETGAEVEILNLAETPLPLYCVEGGYGKHDARRKQIRDRVDEAEAFLVTGPEYHGSMTGTLKNFFDHHYKEFAGKLFGIAAATGGSKGVSVLTHIRATIQYCHGWTLPYNATGQNRDFEKHGDLKNDDVRKRLCMIGRDTAIYGRILHGKFHHDTTVDPEHDNIGFAEWHR
jgi:FMN reductase